jgi:hypothetical protein
MTTKIFEELPSRDNRPAPAGAERPGPTNMKEKMEKKVRQAVYDIRYRARREGVDIKQAYSQYMQNSSLNGQERNLVKAKIFGRPMAEDYNIEEFASNSVAKALFKVFVEGVEEESTLGEEYIQELKNMPDRKYKVRVTDKNGTSYVRYATRDKISDLRANPNIESVEMTEYGEPYEGERSKGDRTAAAKAGKDYDDDGKVESGAKEYRGSVHNAIQRKRGGSPDGRDTSNVKEDIDFFEEKKNSKKGGKFYDIKRKSKKPNQVTLFPEAGKTHNEEFFLEDAVSTAQQKFMGMVHAYKNGEMKNASPEVKKAAQEMSDTEAKKFASTKNEGLPQHVKNEVKEETACDSSEPQRDTRGDYAKKEMIRNRLRSGLGVKNPIVMVSNEDDVKEDLQATVKSGLKKGADFMKTNPVGKAASAVLAPVGTGRGTVTGAEQKRNVAKEEVEMIDERRKEDKGTPRKPRDRAVEILRSKPISQSLMTRSGETLAQHEKERGVKKLERQSQETTENPETGERERIRPRSEDPTPAKKLARKKAEVKRQREIGREMQSSRFD